MSMSDPHSPFLVAAVPLLGVLIVVPLLLLLWGVLLERRWWQLTRERVDCRAAAGSRNGSRVAPGAKTGQGGELRVALLSDFHFHPGSRLDPRLLACLRALDPDLLLLAGDFIDDDRGIDACATALRCLRARYGVFAVLGNHDYLRYGKEDLFRGDHTPGRRNDVGALEAALTRAGIHVLVNESVEIRIGVVEVHLLGLGDRLAGMLDLPRARAIFANDPARAGLRIVLAHSAPPLARLDPDYRTIGLAGHTHGGQVCIPWFSQWWLDRRLGIGHLHGWRVGEHGERVYVNRGIGTSWLLPIRVNARPELAVFDLVADASRSSAASEKLTVELVAALSAEDSAPLA
jgi:predicted MPP superfamily phosphohydrolase